MATCTEPSATILDDGDFYVELNCNDSSAAAAGFLQRRCYVGVTTPGGYECIGSFERDVLGRWRASIDAVYDEQTGSDSRTLGCFADRLDAIVALWAARHAAYCRHQDR